MFTLLFSALAAFNQVLAFAGAFLCAAIGGALLGNAIYWRLHAVRVLGEVIGVRQRQNVFRSVYRYALSSGENCEATSNEGSSSLRGRETGTRVPLLVIPEHTDEVEEARSHVWTFVGGVLLAAGAWLFYIAVTAWPVGPMTWIVAGVLAVHFGIKTYRILLPLEKRLGTTSWKALLSQRPEPDIDGIPVQRSEDILAQPERCASDARQRALQRRWAPLLVLVGSSLLVARFFIGRTLMRLEALGLQAQGAVQTLEMSSPTTHGSAYYPVVLFTAESGQGIRFRDRSGSNPPAYRVGDRVAVRYLASDPHGAIIDRGVWNWMAPVFAMVMGAVLVLVSVRVLRYR
jgi:hypothetical protein